MPDKQDLFAITLSSPEIKTVGEYLQQADSPALSYSGDGERFLNIKGGDGLTNRQRIENNYILPSDKKLKGARFDILPLKVGTLLYIEAEKINQQIFLTEGIEIVSTDEPAFKASELARLEADPGYVSISTPVQGMMHTGIHKRMFPDMTVWIWCRALSPRDQEDGELKGEIFDLSPFIQRISTNVGKDGGNFQISLAPLVAELDSENRWTLKKSTITQYENNSGASLQGTGYVAQSHLFQLKGGSDSTGEYFERSQFYFHNIIRPNDLVFIRYETLELEKDQRYSDSREFYINKKNIAGRIYDMIGLVDTNGQSVNPATNDVTITITGRDLSKLFIDDGVYFQALENSQGMLKFAGQSTLKSSLINRLFANNGMSFIGLYMFTSIEQVLKFVIQQLSFIQVVPQEIFESYGDRRNKRFNETNRKTGSAANSNHQKQFKEELVSGIWQIVKLIIDQSVTGRRVADSSMSTANGSIINFIRAVCQEPLVEVIFDTYGDSYTLTVRKPPHDQKALISLIEGKVNTEDGSVETPPAIVNVRQEDVLEEQLMFDDTEVFSWYHFFPRSALMGDAQNYALSYLGALFFEEYALIWGSKPYENSHSYIPYTGGLNNQEALSLPEKQAIEDLKYVVESHQYLPFTRKGRLTLNRDRRLKVGNIIRYESTGEIFFIDHVTHTYSINDQSIEAFTTISVSRGMIEQLIYGAYLKNESGTPKFVSYYNIINTELNFQEKEVVNVVNNQVQSRPSVSLETIVESGNKGTYYLEKYNKFPERKNLFVRFINGINQLGYRVIITDTFRTNDEQWFLKYGSNGNLNNTEPGTSKHESGTAIDINIVNDKTGEILKKNSSFESWMASGVPGLARSMGLQWAGGNGSFGNYVDRVHFQIAGEVAESEQEIKTETKTFKTKTFDREAIFKSFRVNKFVFNWFLKQGQFGPSYKEVTSRNIYQEGGQLLNEVEVVGKRKK